jgi:GNAT superfamily N-acetyltransferase
MAAVAAVRPLTQATWPDLEAVFGGRGCSFARGCWCMAYRESGRPAPPAGVRLADSRKARLRELTLAAEAAGGPAPGLIGYAGDGRPVGWVTLGPRQAFAKLARSPVMRPVPAAADPGDAGGSGRAGSGLADPEAMWAVVCFVVGLADRHRGVAHALLAHAVAYAREQGAAAIEGFPIDRPGRSQDQWLWHGTHAMFAAAGFQEIARRRPQRPLMRLVLR